ncbi:thymidine phosphorylase [Aurantimonas sp. Leaf443]|uniref:thymidine phosphorylase n=1 Tax=Aurantimonas sp. Leaf443 TaxID=1736378 RepID=UPI000700A722|nr:thymidine phosphorylase [Aurantimonas sp. Leaf443]KQT83051.1 thymidine phosphorylase [Aurantimonas sp. Leaf443]
MAPLPQETIRHKRDGGELAPAAIAAFVEGLSTGRIGEGQIGAFAMAVFLKGMTRAETVALTLALRDSGDVLDWSGLDRPVVDKHSTGGIGDNVSLMLAPLVAACGGAVPMISGRGLGHTGGTLDKLEAIPGYDVSPDPGVLTRLVSTVGCAIVAPTGRLAPADGRLYAVRDVTATVESVPLIVSSILSKKLAAGLGALVLDVKTGSGAFMAREADARALAASLVEVANGAGLRTSALLTRMDEALASAAGNALEVANAVRFLSGAHRDARLERVTLALAGQMLVSAGLAQAPAQAERMAREALVSGRALERFSAMVAGLGGPADFVERADAYLPAAPLVRDVPAPRSGTVVAVDARALGLAVVALGGGRTRPQDGIDPAVGLDRLAEIGREVTRGEPIARVHAARETQAEAALASVAAAYRIAEGTVARADPVVDRIG